MTEQPRESFVTIQSETMHRFEDTLSHIAENCILTTKQKDFLSKLLRQAKKEENWLSLCRLSSVTEKQLAQHSLCPQSEGASGDYIVLH